VALLVSPVHAFEGRPADGPRPDPESLHDLARDLGLAEVPDPHLLRRNIVVHGFRIDSLAAPQGGSGRVFGLDSGADEVRFQAYRPQPVPGSACPGLRQWGRTG
jgi:hypothetical protein